MTHQGDSVYAITLDLEVGEVKFRRDDAWDVNLGSTDFPTGVATQDGPNIPVSEAGTYDITVNVSTGAYDFALQGGGGGGATVGNWGILGSSLPGGFDEDVDMTHQGDSVYAITLDLAVGEVKFRRDDAWDVNIGGSDFPMGVGSPGGPNIPVTTAGRYAITVNVVTNEYNFDPADEAGGEDWGIIGTAVNGGFDVDLDMDFVGNDVYTITLELAEGEVKFRRDDAWDVNLGGDAFPSGTAVPNGANIVVNVAGTYVVTLDVGNSTYDFALQDGGGGIESVGIIGSATPTGWDSDTDMTDEGNGVYSITMTLTDGEVKFRANDAYVISWGTDGDNPEFPTGTAVLDGANIPVTAGTYRITLDTVNLTYAFVEE